MTTDKPTTGVQLRSLVKSNGELALSLESVAVVPPAPNEVLVRIEAAPINPSDIGLLFGAADMSTAKSSGTPDRPIVTARIPEAAMKSMAGRLDASMPVGNEGAGVIVAAGSCADAQALLGKTVAVLGGAMYAQYRCFRTEQLRPKARPASSIRSLPWAWSRRCGAKATPRSCTRPRRPTSARC
jgi:NADPH2:quinone reductase